MAAAGCGVCCCWPTVCCWVGVDCLGPGSGGGAKRARCFGARVFPEAAAREEARLRACRSRGGLLELVASPRCHGEGGAAYQPTWPNSWPAEPLEAPTVLSNA